MAFIRWKISRDCSMAERMTPGPVNHQIGGGTRGVRRAADGNPDIGLAQGRRVIDAIAGHTDKMLTALQYLYDLVLVLGETCA